MKWQLQRAGQDANKTQASFLCLIQQDNEQKESLLHQCEVAKCLQVMLCN